MKIAVITIVVLILFGALGFGIREYALVSESHFAPKEEAVRRNTFEQSRAYNEGVAQQLQSYQLAYVKGTPEQQQAIASMVLHEVAGVDESRLPPSLYAFVTQIKTSQGVQ